MSSEASEITGNPGYVGRMDGVIPFRQWLNAARLRGSVNMPDWVNLARPVVERKMETAVRWNRAFHTVHLAKKRPNRQDDKALREMRKALWLAWADFGIRIAAFKPPVSVKWSDGEVWRASKGEYMETLYDYCASHSENNQCSMQEWIESCDHAYSLLQKYLLETVEIVCHCRNKSSRQRAELIGKFALWDAFAQIRVDFIGFVPGVFAEIIENGRIHKKLRYGRRSWSDKNEQMGWVN